MGVKSTRTITRGQALETIRRNLDKLSNEQLEVITEMVAEASHDRFSNFLVTETLEIPEPRY